MRPALALTLALLALGCRSGDRTVDADADGYSSFEDCDDDDPAVHPGAAELCNGVDDDCDAMVDEDAVDLAWWYPDADADGHGTPDGAVEACEAPEAHVATDDDCDDDEPLAWLGADEACDGVDNDCDGVVDEGFEATTTWYADVDGDGYGDPDAVLTACAQPDGATDDATDCDDARADVHPGADETCDGADQDCDGLVDEDATDAPTWYADYDGDGYGAATWTTVACEAPAGYVASSTDCDDTTVAVVPEGVEVCDGLDNDCDGLVDEDATDAPTWYADSDGDGYGDPAEATVACEAPAATVSDATDCDDTDPQAHPGAVEVCDLHDDDCDGDIDEDAVDAVSWYRDADLDGFGDARDVAEACLAPAGYVGDATDCDDTTGSVSPAADEVCEGLVDEDCDGDIDEDDAIDASTWYIDYDGDGYGDVTYTRVACMPPAGYDDDALDCADTEPWMHPGADELCNHEDDDCDGDVDEGAVNPSTWYVDLDGDGFAGPDAPVQACDAPTGDHHLVALDCDDTQTRINPTAPESCDGVDEDCDGETDEDAGDLWYRDADGDGHGWVGDSVLACDAPSGYVGDHSDCDDTDPGDLDGDGQQDCEDPDIDGDGLANDWDADPYDGLIARPPTAGFGTDGPRVVSGTELQSDWTTLSAGASYGIDALAVADSSPFGVDDEVLLLSLQGDDAGAYQFLRVTRVDPYSLDVSPPLLHDFAAASTVLVLRVPHYTDVTVPAGATLTADGWGVGGGVVAMRATGDIVISGSIDVSGLGLAGGAGVAGNTSDPYQGESWRGLGAAGVTSANDGGGGAYPRRADNGDSGAGGGYGTVGGAGTSYSGAAVTTGGVVYGDAALSTLFLGSGGGGGSPDTEADGSGSGNVTGDGGVGGGVVLLFAGGDIEVDGSVLARGLDGGDAVSADGEIGGGGGGAGGTIWLAAPGVSVTGLVHADGGAGGASDCNSCGTSGYGSAWGGAGGDGRVRVDSDLFTGSTLPAASAGPFE